MAAARTQPFSKLPLTRARGLNLDIDGWLRSIGLEQYAAAFRDNAIDEKVLPRLTAEDLKDLGVGLVGHRRTLLDAIAALRADANAKEPPSDALPHAPHSAQAFAPPPTVAPAAEAVGERRYLTVMFCDLVGSTGITDAGFELAIGGLFSSRTPDISPSLPSATAKRFTTERKTS